jgi:hypothetical protein
VDDEALPRKSLEQTNKKELFVLAEYMHAGTCPKLVPASPMADDRFGRPVDEDQAELDLMD